jgi:hypothetical protein
MYSVFLSLEQVAWAPPSALPVSPARGRRSPMARNRCYIPFSPAGRRGPQADEGDAEGKKAEDSFRITPSSDPSDHLFPAGEKGKTATSNSICDSLPLAGETPGKAEGGDTASTTKGADAC